MFAFLLREHLKISIDRANKLASVLTEETLRCMTYELEEQKKFFLEREKALKEEIEKVNSEPLRDMIKRIAAETVGEEVRNNLTVTKDIDYDGFERISTQWNGTEF
jgi:hypothetical protein